MTGKREASWDGAERQLKIIQHIPDFGLGGIQKAACVLASEFATMGHEVRVVAPKGGPRFEEAGNSNLAHIILPDSRPETLAQLLRETGCDVLHIHDAAFDEALIDYLADGMELVSPLIVSTPVFGRPPKKRRILTQTKTCCVGLYTFYRLCKWTGMDAKSAVENGIGYVPLTPFQPPKNMVSTNDDLQLLVARRRKLKVQPTAFVIGRIGRSDPGKWHPAYESLIDAILTRCDRAAWLSVGFPDTPARARLQRKWQDRFGNIPENSSFDALATILSVMDVQLFLSRSGECFASTIAEAAGIGVPTIALINPLKDNGQAEQVISGVTGELVAQPADAVEQVLQLERNASRLSTVKQSCAAHARRRWHVHRVAQDLISLYSFWRGHADGADYLNTMAAEHQAFSSIYHKRMLELKAPRGNGKIFWRLALFSVENWPMFKFGRMLKRTAAGLKA